MNSIIIWIWLLKSNVNYILNFKGGVDSMNYYVVVDLEMCRVPKGLKRVVGYGREIIQIGATLMDSEYNVIDSFDKYVKPENGKIDRFITNLTGITPDSVKNASNLSIVLDQFIDWLPDNVLAISWSDNDEKQLRHEIKSKGIDIESKFLELLDNWIDCQPEFSDKMNMERIYSLEEALIATDICTEGRAHNGAVDAYNTALLYAKMKKEKELVLNSYYKAAHDDSEPEHLSFSFDDLLLAAGL